MPLGTVGNVVISLEWVCGPKLALLAVSEMALVFFAVAERRLPEATLPFDAFRIRTVDIGTVGNVHIGSAQFLLSSFVTLLAQAVRHEVVASTGTATDFTGVGEAPFGALKSLG